MNRIYKIYPAPAQEIRLEGAYLEHNLPNIAVQTGRPVVYANFITSLDGRIAISRGAGEGLGVPKETVNDRDWRLFQELAAQADILISSGRYLRDRAEGKAQEILQVDDPRYADLQGWRSTHGLNPYPDIAVLSQRLDFTIPEVIRETGRKVVVITSESVDPARLASMEAQVDQVILAGKEQISGKRLVAGLGELGYNSIYSAAGPRVFHLLLAEGVLDRFYLTIANKLLGGREFASILEGELLNPATTAQIERIYLDQDALDGAGQLLICYRVMQPR